MKESKIRSEVASGGMPRAVIYLRVSSRGQLTDYGDDGLSIDGQREQCQRRAADLGAVVVDEYIERAESAKTDDRPALKKMLARIREQQDVDYAILWKVDRFARNRRDDANMLFEIETSGARLISATENIDQTPSGQLMHGMLASFAEYYSRNLANEVIKGATQKAKRGGTPGYAPLGYRNVPEFIDGREIRTIALDEERAPLIRWAFETYATGQYSLADLDALLAARGLRSRGNRRCPPKPLGLSAIHALLGNDYYAGRVTYRRKKYRGRHPSLISHTLFDQVQEVLHAHNRSGERDRRHAHYLKGSVYCGQCGRRLTFSRNRGNGGFYEYFVCSANGLRRCSQAAQRVDHVEAAVERYYATVQLSATDQARIQAALEQHLTEQAAGSQKEIGRCQGVLQRIDTEERKLLSAHYQDQISESLFAEEQVRIGRERKDAEAVIARFSVQDSQLRAVIDQALALASTDLHELYRRATPMVRRFMNQAIFEALWIAHDEVSETLLASPFKELHEVASALQAAGTKPVNGQANGGLVDIVVSRARNAEGPDFWGNRGLLSVVRLERKWSGRQDLNLRPPGPQPGALPDCATPRGAMCQSGRRESNPP